MEHVTMIETTPDGYLGRCTTCGDRNTEYTGYGTADEWCMEHERRARSLALNTGPRSGPKVLERQFREKAQMLVYTPEERAQWLNLADELAERLKQRRTDPIEGQMDLFDEGER